MSNINRFNKLRISTSLVVPSLSLYRDPPIRTPLIERLQVVTVQTQELVDCWVSLLDDELIAPRTTQSRPASISVATTVDMVEAEEARVSDLTVGALAAVVGNDV